MSPASHLDTTWYLHFGASHHLTFIQQNLANGQQVIVGNGQGMPILSLGHYTIFSYTQPSVALHLTNLLHVPQIYKNFMSVIKFAHDNNVFFELHAQKCFIYSQASNQVLLEGAICLYGLYKFKPFKLLFPTGSTNLATFHAFNNFATTIN